MTEEETTIDLQALVDQTDVPALLRAVDGLCASRQWDRLTVLARRCRDAIELGKQLWSVAMHIDYRLALEAPAEHAAAVLRPGAGRFALGPLTEVAASTHDWASLAPHLGDPATTSSVAQERVIRGEDLTADERAAGGELPLRLTDWEPGYALPTYRDRSAEFPAPAVAGRQVPGPEQLSPGPRREDDAGVVALEDVAEVWVSQSAGRTRAVTVSGPVHGAVGHLSPRAGLLAITGAEAMALLQWTGASGGAYGRRRGGAAGRFAAWWSAAALAGLDWPEVADETFGQQLGEAVERLAWFRWHGPEPESGWTLRLAVADDVRQCAWAVDASDHRDPDPLSDPT